MRKLLLAALAATSLVPLTASAAPDPGCSWLAKTEPDTVNVAFPDTNASYWSHPYANAPGTELVVHGTYPRARYFSFHVYQPTGVPVDSIYDAQIRPDKGSTNPFAGGSLAGKHAYTFRVVFTDRPAKPAPNTVYAGQSAFDRVKNPGGLLMLRVYTPTDASSPQGGVPLPTVTMRTTTGAVLTAGTACSNDLPSTGGAGTSALNATSPPGGPQADAGAEISWGKAYGNKAAGFFGNQQNSYLTATINRAYGDLVVIRTRAPRFPDTKRGRYPSARDQLRYWSFCQNSASTRVNACTADYQTAVDRQGYLKIVVSDPARRPTNATAAHGVTWIPWGAADAAGILIYRHMVPAKGFYAHSIQSLEKGDDPVKGMGDYYPTARYCTKAGFERAGFRGCLE